MECYFRDFRNFHRFLESSEVYEKEREDDEVLTFVGSDEVGCDEVFDTENDDEG